jgi:hypothetical protein
LFGAAWVDLRHAVIQDEQITIRAFSLFGTVKIIVPSATGVELTGVSFFGAKTDGASNAPAPVGPIITVKGFPIFGSVRVLNRAPGE